VFTAVSVVMGVLACFMAVRLYARVRERQVRQNRSFELQNRIQACVCGDLCAGACHINGCEAVRQSAGAPGEALGLSSD
jgi:hypothetical protein